VNVQTHDAGVDPLYRAPREAPEWVRVPELTFIAVDGRGDPHTSTYYHQAVNALFALAYTLKFALRPDGLDYRVSPLETLWWSEDGPTFPTGDRGAWRWTMMVRQPDEVTDPRLAEAAAEVGRTRHLPVLEHVRLERFEEGLCAQVLHVGRYSDEGPTIGRLHDFIHAEGLVFDQARDKHHEIYLRDARNTVPEQWQTILRQPAREPAQPPGTVRK
jgi:hypothetical protein